MAGVPGTDATRPVAAGKNGGGAGDGGQPARHERYKSTSGGGEKNSLQRKILAQINPTGLLVIGDGFGATLDHHLAAMDDIGAVNQA
ncbi:hypothetical protein ATL17_3251 [Maritalea mobilis]|uniref:Uncharacterized protein n=1 Tax=Maritalea mobilis TaxID=483324 RepID=A0A4R6VGC3_9HYPH|nr:hypothetical protein ATL17_3251 [Maritalea mobilis]